jgi:hypothetical protein
MVVLILTHYLPGSTRSCFVMASKRLYARFERFVLKGDKFLAQCLEDRNYPLFYWGYYALNITPQGETAKAAFSQWLEVKCSFCGSKTQDCKVGWQQFLAQLKSEPQYASTPGHMGRVALIDQSGGKKILQRLAYVIFLQLHHHGYFLGKLLEDKKSYTLIDPDFREILGLSDLKKKMEKAAQGKR